MNYVKYYVTPLVHDYSDIDLYAVVLIKYLEYLEGCYISGIRAGRSVRPVVVSLLSNNCVIVINLTLSCVVLIS